MSRVQCLLIRHAHCERLAAISEDHWPLSELGREQAEDLRERLVSQNLEELYTSPYSRAQQTLQPLADRLRLSLNVVADLRERRLSGSPIHDWRGALRTAWSDFAWALPGGESSRACQDRVVSAVMGILGQTRASRIGIASHGNAIALFLNRLEPSFGFDDWDRMGNPHIYRLEWDGRAVTWDRSFSLS